MILRGTQIHRDGDGKCGLLPNRTLSTNSAELPFSGVMASAWINPATLWSVIPTLIQAVQHVSAYQDRKPFHLARARFRVARLLPA